MTNPSDSPEHYVGSEIQSLRMAAAVISKRSFTSEGLELLTDSMGDIAAVGAEMILVFNRIKEHNARTSERAA